MKMRTSYMPARKSESVATSVRVQKVETPAVDKPRKFSEVVKQVQKMREEGKTVPEIATELKMSYTVVNQLVLRSYKMVARTEEVFQRQEEMRLGLI